MKRTKVSDGSTWPQPEAVEDGLGWRLTWTEPSRSDLLAAASVVSAYEYLMLTTTAEKRALVIREVRAAVHADHATTNPPADRRRPLCDEREAAGRDE